jgi:hypothetical protein
MNFPHGGSRLAEWRVFTSIGPCQVAIHFHFGELGI